MKYLRLNDMNKVSLVWLLSLFSSIILAQEMKLSENELRKQLDSVLNEGNLLYKYEKSTWISSDLAFENPIVKAEYSDYLTYEDHDVIRTIILSKGLKTCIAEYTFENNFDNPKFVKIEKRELSEKEKNLIDVRVKLLKNVKSRKYGVTAPKGYNLNFILVPFSDKYKLYIITGTTQPNVIPLGNDYIFIADKNGVIESWHKFHSQLIPGYTMYNGNRVVGLVHTHLRTTPLITATEICTFMLYAPLYDVNSLSIISPVIGRYIMKYSLKENEITVNEIDAK